MVGDTGMEAGNTRQRGPLGRKAWGAHIAGIHRARKASVCVRAAGGADENWRALCVRGVPHSATTA